MADRLCEEKRLGHHLRQEPGAGPARLKAILPHHTLDGPIGLTIVFGAGLLVIFHLNRSVYREIDQLSDGHAFVDLYRLFYRYFEGPVAAKTDIAFAGGSMDIDTQPPGRGFPLQERYMGVGLRIFMGDP